MSGLLNKQVGRNLKNSVLQKRTSNLAFSFSIILLNVVLSVSVETTGGHGLERAYCREVWRAHGGHCLFISRRFGVVLALTSSCRNEFACSPAEVTIARSVGLSLDRERCEVQV
jgi:hypothetical protein